MALSGPFDIVDRSLTPGKGQMYQMSAEPIASLYESAVQQLHASSASPQYTPRLNIKESQIAMVLLMMLGSNVQT